MAEKDKKKPIYGEKEAAGFRSMTAGETGTAPSWFEWVMKALGGFVPRPQTESERRKEYIARTPTSSEWVDIQKRVGEEIAARPAQPIKVKTTPPDENKEWKEIFTLAHKKSPEAIRRLRNYYKLYYPHYSKKGKEEQKIFDNRVKELLFNTQGGINSLDDAEKILVEWRKETGVKL